ncbi:hypothetical protein AMAG_17588 [Allomyces macrogynus ATCC 38327]|uniref:Rhodanese domain-containing protein n=1 Tax=Allomyces macrogynus (strain ATCC 38327) TaxID=578462 RepID=A0A0L0TF62_ALLM3|nr:hypothetical protein AMAG_17588 [Allomyces macrogynus ATCC 38327]|eukprot:KNE73392.1 hypothetical protein AMAG_17588 [Allomyces macrogynus ATCC 38327]
MSKKDALADRSFLGKPFPKAKKYSDIRPTIDSGASEANFLRKQAFKSHEHKYLENEMFGRLKPVTLGRLIYETQLDIDLLSMEANITSRVQTPVATRDTTRTSSPAPPTTTAAAPKLSGSFFLGDYSERSRSSDAPPPGRRIMPAPAAPLPPRPPLCSDRLHDSVMHLMADPDSDRAKMHHHGPGTPPIHGLKFNGAADTGYNWDLPYLLLDVRDFAEWRTCHLIGALTYPHVFIRRDQISKDLVMYRNKENKIIVLYDNDECIAAPAAQILCERGFENVFILTGGMLHMVEMISGVLVGDPPTPPHAELPQLQPKRSVVQRESPRPTALPQSGEFNMVNLERSLMAATSTTQASTSRSTTRMSTYSTTSTATAASARTKAAVGGLVKGASSRTAPGANAGRAGPVGVAGARRRGT